MILIFQYSSKSDIRNLSVKLKTWKSYKTISLLFVCFFNKSVFSEKFCNITSEIPGSLAYLKD